MCWQLSCCCGWQPQDEVSQAVACAGDLGCSYQPAHIKQSPKSQLSGLTRSLVRVYTSVACNPFHMYYVSDHSCKAVVYKKQARLYTTGWTWLFITCCCSHGMHEGTRQKQQYRSPSSRHSRAFAIPQPLSLAFAATGLSLLSGQQGVHCQGSTHPGANLHDHSTDSAWHACRTHVLLCTGNGVVAVAPRKVQCPICNDEFAHNSCNGQGFVNSARHIVQMQHVQRICCMSYLAVKLCLEDELHLACFRVYCALLHVRKMLASGVYSGVD